MNVGPSERLETLLWLDRFTLTVVSESCQLFKQVVDAHTAAMPLFYISRLWLRKAGVDSWIVDMQITPYGRFFLTNSSLSAELRETWKKIGFAGEFVIDVLIVCGTFDFVINELELRALQQFLSNARVVELHLRNERIIDGDIGKIVKTCHSLDALEVWEPDSALLDRCIALGISDLTARYAAFTEEDALKYCLEDSPTSKITGIRSLHVSMDGFSRQFFRMLVEAFRKNKSATPVHLQVYRLHEAFDTSGYEDRAVVNGRYKRYSFSDATVPFVIDVGQRSRAFELMLYVRCGVPQCCEHCYK